eukprot:633137-Alexandrium_andersonii.AAC.1
MCRVQAASAPLHTHDGRRGKGCAERPAQMVRAYDVTCSTGCKQSRKIDRTTNNSLMQHEQ